MKKTLLFASLLTLPLFATFASDRYSESFGAPEGGLPQDWTVQKVGQDAVAEVRAMEGARVSHALFIERPGPASTNAAVFFTGNTGKIAGGRAGDLSLSVALRLDGARPTNSSSRGVILRATKQKYSSFDGYYVAVQAAGQGKELAIYSNPVTHIQNGDSLASSPLEKDLEIGVDYLLQVTAKGSTIEAKLFKSDASGGKGNLVSEVVTTEATKTEPGYLGLRGAYGNSGPVGTWFHSLHITSLD